MNTLTRTNTENTDILIKKIIDRGVLRFGNFALKSGRKSPYFFNIGNISDAEGISLLAQYYAAKLIRYRFDVIFGPAYKGISLAAVTAMQLWYNYTKNVGWAYNRKEVKDHGEGGKLVGAELQGRVVIIDDVLTAGTAARESIHLIRQQGGEPVALLLFLDRMEPGQGSRSATAELNQEHDIDVFSVLNIDQIIDWLERQSQSPYREHLRDMQDYRAQLAHR